MMAAIGVREEGGGRNRGGWWGRVKIKESTKRYVRWQIWEYQVTGGRGGVCMHVRYLSIAYLVYSCDVSSLLQEQGADVVMAPKGCTV